MRQWPVIPESQAVVPQLGQAAVTPRSASYAGSRDLSRERIFTFGQELQEWTGVWDAQIR